MEEFKAVGNVLSVVDCCFVVLNFKGRFLEFGFGDDICNAIEGLISLNVLQVSQVP